MCKSHSPSRRDKCLVYLIGFLKHLGVETVACCCGHGKYPMTIVIRNELATHELMSWIKLSRKKRFYKKDKEGYYYIPEVIEKGSRPK